MKFPIPHSRGANGMTFGYRRSRQHLEIALDLMIEAGELPFEPGLAWLIQENLHLAKVHQR